jgi:beta-N-acetylhexosaminidase
MKAMSLRDKVAQLVFIPFHGAAPNARSREYRHFVRMVRDIRVGGLVLVNVSQGRLVQRAEPYALVAFLNRMQRLARTPLMVGGDFERGASMRVDATTVFPHAMAFAAAGDPAAARFEGEVTAREARALGVQWVFFPVSDVNNNPDNPIINIRSYGENPAQVAEFVTAFIAGAKSNPRDRVLTTAKHFPGHGNTSDDTHVNLATIQSDRAHLDEMEFVPFRAAIARGVDSIMTAHIAVPALDQADVPATLSKNILSGILRGELGFRGIVATDALEMGGIAKGFGSGEAAVRAVEAGADALIMPSDPEAAVNALVAAVRQGRLTQQRIEQSVLRLLAAKELVGLSKLRRLDPERIAEDVNAPESNQRAQEIADRAVTLVKNDAGLVPLSAPAKTCFLTLIEGRSSTQGVAFAAEVRRRVQGAPVMTVDASMLPDDTLAAVSSCDTLVAAAFASVAAYRGNLALGGNHNKLLDALIATGKPVVLVALGNPYLVRNFPDVRAYLTTYSTVPPSEVAAVKALFGEIPIRGHLPVSIPGIAKYGDGLTLPVRATVSQAH